MFAKKDFRRYVISAKSYKRTSRTAKDVPGKGADKIIRMEESSLYTALESPDTTVALAVGGLAGALWEESVLLANARHLFGCYCWFIGGNGGY